MSLQKINDKTKETVDGDGNKIQWESFDFGSRELHEHEVKSEEYKEMADELGLEGVKNFIENFNGSVVPFPEMSRVEERVWNAYCPSDTRVEEYENFIPMEVLELLKKCKENDYFDGYEVWDETSEDVDPLLVGVNQPDDSHTNNYHLIARWGYALRKFDDIVETVKKQKVAEQTKRLKSRLKRIEQDVEDWFNGTYDSWGSPFISS